jgi:hypothetical protein
MAKEWDKFQADYKKLKPSIEKYSASEASAVLKRVTIAKAALPQGERNLSESMVTARKNGVTGKGLPDFMKDKSFSEAKKLLDVAVGMMVETLKEIDTFAAAATGVADEVADLHAKILKDLKGRKDSSESKKDIEKLRDTLYDHHGVLAASGKINEKVIPYLRGYVGNYMKTINGILAEAPDEQEEMKESTELPQLLVDRNIKKNYSAAMALAETVQKSCDEAIEQAQVDLKAALPHIKAAQVALVKLKKIADDYEDVVNKFKDNLEVSKDKSKIEKMIAAIDKALVTSARTFKGVSTTIKKAD